MANFNSIDLGRCTVIKLVLELTLEDLLDCNWPYAALAILVIVSGMPRVGD